MRALTTILLFAATTHAQVGYSSPSVISKADPEYSEEARLAKVNSSVMLSVVIGVDGVPRGLSAGGTGLRRQV
jgi:hypothetical protein